MQLSNDIVRAAIEQRLPGSVLQHDEPYGMLTLETSREQILPILEFVKNDPDLQVQLLTSLCGVHYPEQEGRELGVVYHLHSMRHNFRFRTVGALPWRLGVPDAIPRHRHAQPRPSFCRYG